MREPESTDTETINNGLAALPAARSRGMLGAIPVCITCGKEIERRTFPGGQQESKAQWRRRRFCDMECRRNKHSPQGDRYCRRKECGKLLERHQFPSGDVEAMVQFARRVYCSRECSCSDAKNRTYTSPKRPNCIEKNGNGPPAPIVLATPPPAPEKNIPPAPLPPPAPVGDDAAQHAFWVICKVAIRFDGPRITPALESAARDLGVPMRLIDQIHREATEYMRQWYDGIFLRKVLENSCREDPTAAECRHEHS